MHHHLTLTELAQREGMTEAETLENCQRLGVPVLHGRVDRSLFASAVHSADASKDPDFVELQASIPA